MGYPQPTSFASAMLQPTPVSTPSGDADFGDFEGAPSSASVASSSKWGKFDALVNLSGLSKNEDKKATAESGAAKLTLAAGGFKGLDGFSRDMGGGFGDTMMGQGGYPQHQQPQQLQQSVFPRMNFGK